MKKNTIFMIGSLHFVVCVGLGYGCAGYFSDPGREEESVGMVVPSTGGSGAGNAMGRSSEFGVFRSKRFSEREQLRWQTYEVFLDPNFSLSAGGDWSELRKLLDNDLEGTLEQLAELQLSESAHDTISMPLYLADYLSGYNYKDALGILNHARKDESLHDSVLEELTVKLTDKKGREHELKDHLASNPESSTAQKAAFLVALRLAEYNEGAESVIAFAESLPNGITKSNLIEGALLPWIQNDLARAEEYINTSLDHSKGEYSSVRVRLADQVSRNGDHDKGLKYAMSIADPDARSTALSLVVENWQEMAPETLASYLKESLGGLEPHDQNTIKSVLEYKKSKLLESL